MIKLSKSRKKTSARNKKTARSGGPGEVKSWRLVLIMVGFSAAILVIAARLVHVQILQHDTYEERATSQQINSLKLVASRGTIYDCNNVELAIDDISYELSVYVYKKSNAELRSIARALAGVIRGSYASILKRLHSNSVNVSFKQRITE